MSTKSMIDTTASDEIMGLDVPLNGSCADVDQSCAANISRGAANHGTGKCKPCAWFWKEQGCLHGRECGFCHLCPREEIKARRRAKASSARTDMSTGKTQQQELFQFMECPQRAELLRVLPSPPVEAPVLKLLPQSPPPSGPPTSCPVMPLMPPLATLTVVPPPPVMAPTFLIPPALPPPPASDVTEIAPITRCMAFNSAEPSAEALVLHSQSAPVTPRSFVLPMYSPIAPPPSPEALSGKMPSDLIAPPPSPEADFSGKMPSDPLAMTPPPGLLGCSLPSLGSAHHGTGRCKPCGWFWKAGGCANGLECCHCHLCPRDEIHARRRAKIALIRHHKVLAANSTEEQEQDANAANVHLPKEQEHLPQDEAGSMAAQQQLPKLLGRLRPAPLTLNTESSQRYAPHKAMPDQRTTPILRLSDRV